MIPRTLSASSLQVWSLCPDRWNAEYMNRAPGFSNSAADTGTAVHGGLELFVKACFIDKTHTGLTRVQQKELLVTFYKMSYVQTFGTADMDTPEYKDGFDLTMKWFSRTDLDAKQMVGVESAEVKQTIKVPYNHPDGTQHELDFNYLMDRVDQIDESTWEVIDYKTIRVPIQPDELETKIQARAYGLALQILHPEATKIKVTFDLLRHEPVTIWLSREDNIAFWRYLCAETQNIINTEESEVRPRLNPECGYCVKKFSCPLMTKNIAAGGIFSLDVDGAVNMIDMLKSQMKANNLIIDQLEEKIMMHAAATDSLEWETSDGVHKVEITSQRRRSFPADKAAEIMGPDLFSQMGNMTLGNLEKIIKDESLDPIMRAKLQDLVTYTNGALGVRVKPKSKIV